jgi:hypothetical protein
MEADAILEEVEGLVNLGGVPGGSPRYGLAKPARRNSPSRLLGGGGEDGGTW